MKIYLTGGNSDKYALVDADAPALVLESKWSLSSKGYAKTNIRVGDGKFTTVKMHRIVMDAKPGDIVDHINRNPLDNRKENLRFVSQFENGRNKKVPNNKHGYKGVSTSRASLGYVAAMNVDGRSKYLGTYPTPEAAALAYNDEVIRLDGALAITNDVSEEHRQPRTSELRFHGVLKSGKPRSLWGYWGVSNPHGDKFSAQYRGEYLGCFLTPEEAARAYDVRARADGYYRVNFPE